jgi:hypothetical protein
MFFEPISPYAVEYNDAFAALFTLMLMGFLVFIFFQTKPTTQRAFLRFMLQPFYASSLIFTGWLCALLFCHLLSILVI